jgi:hypothetical protein
VSLYITPFSIENNSNNDNAIGIMISVVSGVSIIIGLSIYILRNKQKSRFNEPIS